MNESFGWNPWCCFYFVFIHANPIVGKILYISRDCSAPLLLHRPLCTGSLVLCYPRWITKKRIKLVLLPGNDTMVIIPFLFISQIIDYKDWRIIAFVTQDSVSFIIHYNICWLLMRMRMNTDTTTICIAHLCSPS